VETSNATTLPDVPAPQPVAHAPGVPKYWGIMEACRRIAAVRSIAEARSRALRERPLPSRDSGDGEPKFVAVG
jgi:hypothetical protein